MNKLEKIVYGLVKKNPRIKTLIRDVYQAGLAIVPVEKERSSYPVTVRPGYFFGFHDKIPWSAGGEYLLAHSFGPMVHKVPGRNDQVDIGFFTGPAYLEFRKVARTPCFNWQQGSMLQWVGANNVFLFNNLRQGKPVAQLYSVDGQEIDILSEPASALSPDGNIALSYNFSRLQEYAPGYGYYHGSDPEMEKMIPSGSGLVKLELSSHARTLLFTVADIALIQPEKSMEGAFHYFTHCLFAPGGQRFLFLHRWIKNRNFVYTRLFSCDINGTNLHLFGTQEMVSHLCWQDDQYLMAYCSLPGKKDGYIRFRDLSMEYDRVGEQAFSSDGHPSFLLQDPRWFITDTYPDRFRRSYLILYDFEKELRYNLGRYRQPVSYREEVRCDLHPRWKPDGTMVCFDSAHPGRRSLCTMDLGNAIEMGQIQTV